MYERLEKIFGYVMFIIMCVSLLPVMYVGRYNHPTGDDYYYGIPVKQVFEDGGNVLDALQGAAKGVAYQYEHWQGTYSAMFLMHFPPNVFGEGMYAFVTTGMILIFAVSSFFMLKPVVCNWMKGSKHLWLIISSAYVLLSLQTVNYFIGESLFWYNGSMYYTGYYALTMMFMGIVIRYLQESKPYHIPIMAVFSVFLAGGNYVSLLPCILLMATLAVILVFRHSKKSVVIGVMVLLMLAGLVVSAVAPGNQIRQAGLFERSAVKAVLKSLLQGVRYIVSWTGIWWVLAVLILTPFLWHGFSRIKFRFPYPVIVLGYMYGIFCSMACPTFYAMNSTGPGRALAIVYYGLMAFMLFSYYYLLGYIHRKVKEGPVRTSKALEFLKKKSLIIYAGLFVLLFVMQISTGKMQEVSTVRAVKLLYSGEAEAYHQEYLERLEILEDDTVQDVVFEPFVHQPDMLFVGDFTGDINNPNNIEIARYWGKNSIMVDYE